jgi:hypothetical protein
MATSLTTVCEKESGAERSPIFIPHGAMSLGEVVTEYDFRWIDHIVIFLYY